MTHHHKSAPLLILSAASTFAGAVLWAFHRYNYAALRERQEIGKQIDKQPLLNFDNKVSINEINDWAAYLIDTQTYEQFIQLQTEAFWDHSFDISVKAKLLEKFKEYAKTATPEKVLKAKAFTQLSLDEQTAVHKTIVNRDVEQGVGYRAILEAHGVDSLPYLSPDNKKKLAPSFIEHAVSLNIGICLLTTSLAPQFRVFSEEDQKDLFTQVINRDVAAGSNYPSIVVAHGVKSLSLLTDDNKKKLAPSFITYADSLNIGIVDLKRDHPVPLDVFGKENKKILFEKVVQRSNQTFKNGPDRASYSVFIFANGTEGLGYITDPQTKAGVFAAFCDSVKNPLDRFSTLSFKTLCQNHQSELSYFDEDQKNRFYHMIAEQELALILDNKQKYHQFRQRNGLDSIQILIQRETWKKGFKRLFLRMPAFDIPDYEQDRQLLGITAEELQAAQRKRERATSGATA